MSDHFLEPNCSVSLKFLSDKRFNISYIPYLLSMAYDFLYKQFVKPRFFVFNHDRHASATGSGSRVTSLEELSLAEFSVE